MSQPDGANNGTNVVPLFRAKKAPGMYKEVHLGPMSFDAPQKPRHRSKFFKKR